ncbi:HTH-type transcriptional activator mta [Methanobrevibacter cuticularis]|uniref:HTH-type transcriptional activator mta n=1 Tax=Methanobrevibacter cuticularis TaxID=47311 RepID=A0A166D9D1_9EURY|nr:TipAS antibiotic-recognition domain-containing protein [Methanobrevibacter cuticularis]KZX15342.1 HTH-type transcriptional activator mta [Methanobrevibacter cuticularis]
MVSDKDVFQGLSLEDKKKYRKDTINRYGRRSFKKANKKINKLSKAEWDNYQSNLNTLIEKIAQSMETNSYTSKKVQKLIAKHFKLVGTLNPTTLNSYIELANLYSEHEDFIAFFNNYNEGLAEFLTNAMIFYAESEIED